MPHLTALSVADLLDAIASSRQPVPAGGSAAALTGAAGASLLLMAATMPRTRTGAAGEAEALAAGAARLRPLRDTLIELIDRDRDAYDALIAARRAARAAGDDGPRHQELIAAATRAATEVPLETMRAARGALGSAESVARAAVASVGGDVAVGIELLLAAVRGAAASVDSNLPALSDVQFAERVASERRRLEDESMVDAARARDAIRGSGR